MMTTPPFANCLAIGATLCLVACGGGDGDSSAPAAAPVEAVASTCAGLATTVPAGLFPDPTTAITSSKFNAATAATATAAALPAHCEIVGTINKRVMTVGAVNGQSIAIGYHMRLPDNAQWNGRFYFMGGGGQNGVLGDALGTREGRHMANGLSLGYAVISQDSGHDNTLNFLPNAGGTAAFGLDPQARSDFYYNSYDKVTLLGKALIQKFYGKAPDKSYFVGCSEGGRQALMMSQRFPSHFDGLLAGAPVLHTPKLSPAGAATVQAFVPVATANGLVDSAGLPAVNKVFTDPDLQLVANAVAQTCDALDGVTDGIVANYQQCTNAVIYSSLATLTCTGAKTAACLTAAQIAAIKTSMAVPKNAKGEPIYSDWPWDPGMAGSNNGTFNAEWRSWFMGTFGAPANDARKISTGAPSLSMLWTTPPNVIPTTQFASFILNYDVSSLSPDSAKNFPASGIYTESPGAVHPQDSVDLSTFRNRGGKLLIYHGVADSAVSFNDTKVWFDAMSANMGSTTGDFAKFFPVPGMNHCRGGPSTDTFDMLTPLVEWVEKGTAPSKIIATASAPAYFGAAVAARSRPLCPHPTYARYSGRGDINDAANFFCSAN